MKMYSINNLLLNNIYYRYLIGLFFNTDIDIREYHYNIIMDRNQITDSGPGWSLKYFRNQLFMQTTKVPHKNFK